MEKILLKGIGEQGLGTGDEFEVYLKPPVPIARVAAIQARKNYMKRVADLANKYPYMYQKQAELSAEEFGVLSTTDMKLRSEIILNNDDVELADILLPIDVAKAILMIPEDSAKRELFMSPSDSDFWLSQDQNILKAAAASFRASYISG